MAIDKINSKALVDCSVAAVDIKDGTITTAKLASTLDISSKTVTLPNTSVTNAQLAGSIANAKLANSTVTINGTAIALGASGSIPAVSWQSVVTGDTTMVAGRGYFVDTSSSAVTMTLPSSASAGDTIAIKDYAGTFGSNALTVARNSHKIQGQANNSQISTNRASLILVYADATKGWLYTVESNVGDLRVPLFTEATGGTVTTSGDYKIHTFTGDGCFVVSQIGNAPGVPTGGPSTVSYLVVAGGGAGADGGGSGGGGGGAGGVREGRDIGPSYTASPLVAPTGLSITAQTYPVTVGAGGADDCGPNQGNNGSNSVFSTITSTGGGGGGSFAAGNTGGSGGGGGGSYTDSSPDAGGAGNTPPVSPPQGNNGGQSTRYPSSASNAYRHGGGGGGAGAAGGDAPDTPSNPSPSAIPGPGAPNGGGNGVTTNITGSPVTYGGGGGGVKASGGPGQPQGGTGGGGDGSFGQPAHSQTPSGSATAGGANTGGGGGGYMQDSPTYNPGSVSTGGKGIVVIRYKYQ